MISHDKIVQNNTSLSIAQYKTSIHTSQLHLVVNHGRQQITDNRAYKIIPYKTNIIPLHNTEQHIAQHYRRTHHIESHDITAHHITAKNSPVKHTRLRYKDNKTQYTTHHTAPQHKTANDNILFHTAEQSTSTSSRRCDRYCSMTSHDTTSNTVQHHDI